MLDAWQCAPAATLEGLTLPGWTCEPCRLMENAQALDVHTNPTKSLRANKRMGPRTGADSRMKRVSK